MFVLNKYICVGAWTSEAVQRLEIEILSFPNYAKNAARKRRVVIDEGKRRREHERYKIMPIAA